MLPTAWMMPVNMIVPSLIGLARCGARGCDPRGHAVNTSL
jgi:hypothetical protein